MTVDPPLLLLHGFTGSAEAWGAPLREALAARRRVLAVDLPGHGGRPILPSGGPSGVPGVVDRLSDLLERRGISRAVWIGYSMGGRIALAGAVLRPGRVAALVLESASPGLDGESARRERRALDEQRARALEDEGLEAWVDAWMSLPLFASQRDLPVEVRDRERSRRLRNSVAGLAWSLRELGTGRQPSFWEDLAGVDVPVLLLTGAKDEKFGSIADAMAEALPRARRVTVPGAGHAVHLEAPEAWLGAVGEFLDDVAPAEATSPARVGVISDTHGLLRAEALSALEDCDLIVHAGDVGDPAILDALRRIAPVRAVRGNVDRGGWASELPWTDTLEVGGRTLHVLHILEELSLDPRAAGVDVVIHGHTHRPARERRRGVLFLNPGSAGPRRFDLPVSLAHLRLGRTGVAAELVELDPD